MSASWKAEDHTTLDKRFTIEGPGDLTLYVDYDDVNHAEVDAEVVKMLRILNAEDAADALEVSLSDAITAECKTLRDSLDKAIQGVELLGAFTGGADTRTLMLDVLRRTSTVLGDIIERRVA